jgi:hypothetical protein
MSERENSKTFDVVERTLRRRMLMIFAIPRRRTAYTIA